MFIHYNTDQLVLPMDIEVLIPQKHLCRIVSHAVDQLSPSIFLKLYPGGGRPAYHPRMMLKVILYAYTQKIYSSREIAKQLKENIYFMWLSGNQTPDFRTINRFRAERMKDVIYETFFAIVDLLQREGLAKLEDYYLYGTKLEANANRYTFVWKRSTHKYEQKLDEKFQLIVNSIEDVSRADEQAEQEKDFQEKLEEANITSDTIKETLKAVDERLEENPKDRVLKKAKRVLEKDLLPRKEKYERQKVMFGNRNSYSKTDPDATFMRMKDDHMRNGQLKPGYNFQIGTEGQFITGYSLHQRPGDAGCLIPHLELLEEYNRPMPKALIADSGYGSEENYTYCEGKQIEAFIKYNTLDKEQTKRWKEQIGRIENMDYDQELDEWICANGRRLTFKYERKAKSENGYVSIKRVYKCTECHGCPFQAECTKGKEEKTVTVSMVNHRQRKEVRERLSTEEGQRKYALRKLEPEPVFGHIKHNGKLNRLSLRGLSKNKVDLGLICVAYNLKKWNSHLNQRSEISN